MKERNFSKIEQQRIVCKNQFSGLKNVFESINDLLDMKIVDNKGLDLCRTPTVYITERKKDLLRKSLKSITLLEIGAGSKNTAFKTSITQDINDTYRKITDVSNAITLFSLIKSIKTIYKRCQNFRQDINFNINHNLTNVGEEIVDFLKYIIDVLKLEKQQLIEKNLVYDTQINAAGYGAYEADSALDAQINAIFTDDSWSPKVSDIKQGIFADCSLLSALLSIIEEDKNAIKKCFVRANKNFVQLRFFKIKIVLKPHQGTKPARYQAIPIGKVLIEVEKKILKSASKKVGNQAAPWVNIFEKAAAIYKGTDGYVTTDSRYCQMNIIDNWKINNSGGNISVNSLEWGYGFIFLAAITGKSVVLRNIPLPDMAVNKKFPGMRPRSNIREPWVRNYSEHAQKLYDYFDRALKNNRVILAVTRNERIPPGWAKSLWVTKEPGNPPKKRHGLVARHSYAVVGVRTDIGGFKYIILQNPHMREGVDYQRTIQGKIFVDKTAKPSIERQVDPTMENGKLVMELNSFIKYFGSYDICSKIKK